MAGSNNNCNHSIVCLLFFLISFNRPASDLRMREKKTRTEKKKTKQSSKTINAEPIQVLDTPKTKEQEAEDLYKQVSEMNNQFIDEGNKVLLKTLPDKIQEMTEYIKVGNVTTVFKM